MKPFLRDPELLPGDRPVVVKGGVGPGGREGSLAHIAVLFRPLSPARIFRHTVCRQGELFSELAKAEKTLEKKAFVLDNCCYCMNVYRTEVAAKHSREFTRYSVVIK